MSESHERSAAWGGWKRPPAEVMRRVELIRNGHDHRDWVCIDFDDHTWLVAKLYHDPGRFTVVAAPVAFESPVIKEVGTS